VTDQTSAGVLDGERVLADAVQAYRVRTTDTGATYQQLAALGRRLATAAGLVAAESEQR
jgi:hypothetical protein